MQESKTQPTSSRFKEGRPQTMEKLKSSYIEFDAQCISNQFARHRHLYNARQCSNNENAYKQQWRFTGCDFRLTSGNAAASLHNGGVAKFIKWLREKLVCCNRNHNRNECVNIYCVRDLTLCTCKKSERQTNEERESF